MNSLVQGFKKKRGPNKTKSVVSRNQKDSDEEDPFGIGNS